MAWLDLTVSDALKYLQVRRQCVRPKAGFHRQLKDFELDLKHVVMKELRSKNPDDQLLKNDFEVQKSSKALFCSCWCS